MPRYEYVCRDCGHNFETQQRIVDDPLLNCPSCKQDALERIVSRTSFALKGGGWYADGYGGGGGSSGNGASGSNGSSLKSTSKSETTSSTSTVSESASSETKSSTTESKPKTSGAE